MRDRSCAAAILLGILALVTGCAVAAGAAVGAAGYAWVKGELKRSYPVSREEARAAVVAALRDDMGFVISLDSANKVKAKMPDDKTVEVKLSYGGPKVTTVSVRVGIMGDRTISEMIFKNISKRLGYDT
ncbi:MAG: DUF3568 family protein [Planctomycetota bacterium]